MEMFCGQMEQAAGTMNRRNTPTPSTLVRAEYVADRAEFGILSRFFFYSKFSFPFIIIVFHGNIFPCLEGGVEGGAGPEPGQALHPLHDDGEREHPRGRDGDTGGHNLQYPGSIK